MSRIERRNKLRQKERELRQGIEEVGKMTDAIDAGRGLLHAGLDDMYISSEEMKGQITIIKERQAWLIGELDRLRDELKGTE